MAGPRSIKEKVHLPLYDSITIEPKKQLSGIQIENGFKFFIQTKGKSKLETNVGLLSELGRFEGWGMRVVIASNGAEDLIGKLIYNTVTTLYVGEKIMIQMPTWFFPAGAGPYSETGRFTTHGEPSPMATFRFAEAIQVDRGQNFRVEMAAPHVESFKELRRTLGPTRVWVALDGYFT